MADEELQTITAVSVDHSSPYRAWYLLRDPVLENGADVIEGGRADSTQWKAVRWRVSGWAAMGQHVFPLRIEDSTGLGVLVGHDSDPLRDGLLGVLVAGEPLSALGDEVDERVRTMIRADMEIDDDADQD